MALAGCLKFLRTVRPWGERLLCEQHSDESTGLSVTRVRSACRSGMSATAEEGECGGMPAEATESRLSGTSVRSDGKKCYGVYTIQCVGRNGEKWVCEKRYSDFAALRKALLQDKCEKVKQLEKLAHGKGKFPKKKRGKSTDPAVMALRKEGFDVWLGSVMTYYSENLNVRMFLTEALPPEGVPRPLAAAAAAADAALAADDYGEYTRDGISLDGLLHVIRLFEGQLPEGATTSELCQKHIKPLTVAPGWVDEPQLIELDDQGNDVSAKEWYKHVYSRQSSSSSEGGGGGGATIRQVEAPPGTRSICRLLAADAATARFVGKPTHFLSHAWLYRILDVAGALEAFVSSLPAGSRERTFFWFDCFSLDQVSGHVCASVVIWLLFCRRGRVALLTLLLRCLRCAARPEHPGERVVEHDLHAGHRQHGPHCDGEQPVTLLSFSDLT
eukprot:COSAG06_NODE_157_length_21766_cov_172.214335_19_plen_443_part_00